jgi:hypothetical protein
MSAGYKDNSVKPGELYELQKKAWFDVVDLTIQRKQEKFIVISPLPVKLNKGRLLVYIDYSISKYMTLKKLKHVKHVFPHLDSCDIVDVKFLHVTEDGQCQFLIKTVIIEKGNPKTGEVFGKSKNLSESLNKVPMKKL